MISNIFKKNNNAFTLAEVLITLLIIGVISSIVIPNVILNQQNVQYTIAFKKAFGTLNNGFKLIMANAGCSDITCTNILNADTDITITNIANTSVFNYSKKCNVYDRGCHDNLVKYLNNIDAWVVRQEYAVLLLEDGIIFGLHGTIDPTCSIVVGSGKLSQSCVTFAIIDINGEKPPNKFGRDVFRVYLLKTGEIVPTGMDNDTRFGSWKTGGGGCLIGSTGQTCAARIVEEGWEMKY